MAEHKIDPKPLDRDKNNDRPPIPSASQRDFPRWIIYAGFIPVSLCIVGLIRDPVAFFYTAGTGLSVVLVAYSLLRIMACLTPLDKDEPVHVEVANLPTFTILLPVYKEAHMIGSLVHHVRQTNYPLDLLDIVIVCEPEDKETILAAQKVSSGRVRTFITDGSLPRTKPHALNAALSNSQGDIVTVYDAEDRPSPDQLHQAASTLSQDTELGVVQAPLTYYNSHKNWLTRQFSLEYNALFRVWLPFLKRLGLPFPLGGTSNHIRRAALMDVGGWDSHNVTEDADFSFRLAAYGWRLGYISNPTYEEAVSTWPQWIYQRARWMKGYIQTWITHMRDPFRPGGRQGYIRAFTLQFTVGVTLITGLLHLPCLILLSLSLGISLVTGRSELPPPFILGSVLTCYVAGIIIGITGAIRARQYKLLLSVPFMPLYWLALMPPTMQALRELRERPFHWNKTDHGDSEANHMIAA